MKIHMVKKGDTMYAIAQKYNVPLEQLIKANPEIPNPDLIDVGMKVKIPMSTVKPAYELMHQHTVQQGDTLWKLSKAWGVPLADMIKANPQLKNPNVLLTGEVVNIPKVPLQIVQGMETGPGSHHHGWHLQEGHGKKFTGVKAETGIMAEMEMKAEVAPAPLPELPVMPNPPVNAPVLPAVNAPVNAPVNMPVMPAEAANPPYPMPYPHEHDLFAQYPVPAVEAAAQPNVGPNVSPAASAAAPNAEYANVYPGVPDYGYPAAYGHDYDDPYGHDQAGSIEGAVGSVYHPMDVSGYSGAKEGFGDISHTGPTTGAPSQGVSGYLPAYVPGLVSPASAANVPSGCAGCGGTPSWQAPAFGYPNMPGSTAVSPFANTPAMPAMPAMPANMMPTAVSPAAAHPNMGWPGVMGPETFYGHPYDGYAASPYGMAPYAAYPYPGYGYPAFPADMYPAAGALPLCPEPVPCPEPHGVPSLREQEQNPAGASSSVSLHAAEGPETAPAGGPKKRQSPAHKKSKASRRLPPRSKESLPWIK